MKSYCVGCASHAVFLYINTAEVWQNNVIKKYESTCISFSEDPPDGFCRVVIAFN